MRTTPSSAQQVSGVYFLHLRGYLWGSLYSKWEPLMRAACGAGSATQCQAAAADLEPHTLCLCHYSGSRVLCHHHVLCGQDAAGARVNGAAAQQGKPASPQAATIMEAADGCSHLQPV